MLRCKEVVLHQVECGKVPKSSVKLANKKREQAAFLVAEDRHSDPKIAEMCGISERAAGKWKNRPEFAERVEELTSTFADRVLRFGLARRERRRTVLSDMHERTYTYVRRFGGASPYGRSCESSIEM